LSKIIPAQKCAKIPNQLGLSSSVTVTDGPSFRISEEESQISGKKTSAPFRLKHFLRAFVTWWLISFVPQRICEKSTTYAEIAPARPDVWPGRFV
jgi:hypothetical protein